MGHFFFFNICCPRGNLKVLGLESCLTGHPFLREIVVVECIVSLPDQLFFNTGISTYIWIVTNKKKSNRKGKVQLIDGSSFHQMMKKSLGSKRKFITDSQLDSIIQLYEKFEENEYSKIYPNQFFGYSKVTIEQPLIEDGKVKRDKSGNPKPTDALTSSSISAD